MTSTGPSAEAQRYLESLMHAGQDAMKQFDHALCRQRVSARKSRFRRADTSSPLP